MGSDDGAATASAQAEAIKDLQARLAAAKAANAALQAVVDADNEAVKASAKGKHIVHSAFGNIDDITVGKTGVYLQNFELPRRAARPGGLPVPFEPNEV
ncbi:hypothetical protein I4F81_012872 [Pyropia yezoensis]|uniref:Uncharacterized protein n=1 Tax=Pyropia yezoensis TaxID=2788 RepID=A0ACC3CJN1_PYRYE|nr:hypothetical protein I4F81_012872 [Neopyropia yezoensis]